MDSNNSICSCYLSEKAKKGRGLVRPGMSRERGGFGYMRPVYRRGTKSGLWHGRVARGSRRKERGARWVRGRKLTFNLLFGWG